MKIHAKTGHRKNISREIEFQEGLDLSKIFIKNAIDECKK